MTTKPSTPASASSELPLLDSLDDLRTFLNTAGYFPEDTRVTADLFDLQPHQALLLDGARMIALAGEARDDPMLTVFFVPRDSLSKEVRTKMRKALASRSRDGLIFCTETWQTLTLYLLRQQDEENRHPTWTMNVQALRPNDLQALAMLDIHAADVFELDRHLLRAFRRAERETLYTNQGFFSNYYLLERLEDDHAEWRTLAAKMEPLGKAVESILSGASAGLDTAATGQQLVRPLLAALDWQVDKAPKGAQYDLALKAGGKTIAICNVVAAGTSLELTDDAQDAGSPDLRMIAALTEQQKQGVLWGILTNGTTWRLFGSFASSASGVYYEVDLPDLLAIGTTEDLRFFTAFFGAAGLVPPDPQQAALIMRIYQDGQRSAQEVGKNLKHAIFAQVFVDLATGLAEALRRRGDAVESAESLNLLYRATLILLYRLLFLLYAESRRLLPTTHLRYYPHSLSNLLKKIALQRNGLERAGHELPMGPTAPWIWETLQHLFAAIDAGQPAWGVPRYNGGLFSATASDAHALLAGLDNVGADYLAMGLDGLARDAAARRATHPNGALRMIDYMALDVRRLGSIYEGLLEFQLRRNDTGGLFLENTRRERKASGSYYTPDYIVKYIVEHAVGPVLQARARLFQARMNDLRTKRTELKRASSSAIVKHLRDEVEKLERAASETLLDLKILDPAMGSGHFLVSTVDYLSDQIIAVLEQYRDDNPLYPQLRRIRESIKASMREQGLDAQFIRDEQLTNRSLLRRMVMKRCVYGVDLNDLAVELARLSLWLHSFTVGAPLSFLDHHLKWGNSLIGTRVTEVEAQLKTDLFGGPFAGLLAATTQMDELVHIADATYAELEQSETLYRSFAQTIAPYKAMLDIWVSQHFGNRYAKEFLTLFQGDTVRALCGELEPGPNYRAAIDQGQALAAEKRLFHWDLEFPEVFVDLQREDWKDEDAAGFDAVIGNPPYSTDFSQEDRDYFEQAFAITGNGYKNLALFMTENGYAITKDAFGFIVPKSLTYSDGWRSGVELLWNDLTHAVDPSKAWKEVLLEMSVVIARKHSLPGELVVGQFENGKVTEISITKSDWVNFRILPTSSDAAELAVAQAIWANAIQWCQITENYRGKGWQRHCTDAGEYIAVRGDALDRFAITPNAYLPRSFIEDNKESVDRYLIKCLVAQNVVAHVENPIDRIILIGALSDEKFIPLDTVNNIVLTNEKWSPKALLALFNSYFLSWYMHRFVYNRAIRTMHLDESYTGKLPAPRIHFTTPQHEREQRTRELSTQAEAMTAPDAALEPLRDVAQFRASALGQALAALLPVDEQGQFVAFAAGASGAEEQSDVVHDLLAHLAQRMIDLNKQKQAETRRFLGWLEARLDIEHKGKTGIDALTGKTTLQHYLGDYQKGEEAQPWEAVLAVLSRNKGKFGVGKQALEGAAAGTLRTEYERSLAVLRPIKAQLARTDTLIDQVVYLLYGLTADEVAVVERSKAV